MSATPNHSNFEAALGKLHAFCSAPSLLKSEGELRNSFDSFIVGNRGSLPKAEVEQRHSDFESLEEVLQVLYELREQLAVDCEQHVDGEISQTDSSNRLYASLKRHPE